MFSKLKLSHKVYLIVAIPLACELLFVGLLYFMLKDAEVEINNAIQSRLIVSKINNLYFNLIEGVIYSRVESNPISRSETLVLRIESDLDELETMCSGNERDLKFVRNLRVKLREAVIDAISAKRIQESKNLDEHRAELTRKLSKIQSFLDGLRAQYSNGEAGTFVCQQK